MKNHIKLSLIATICFIITSCAALRQPQISKLEIGMNKQAAIAATGKDPYQTIGVKKYPNGTVEVFEYVNIVDTEGHKEKTWLYFYNDKLVQFGKPAGNWLNEADIIVAESK